MPGNHVTGQRRIAAALTGFLPPVAIAQNTATVYIEGVGGYPVPMLSDPLLVTLAVCLVLIVAFKLQRSGFLAFVTAGMAIMAAVANSPWLTAASGLDIPRSSPACKGRAISITFNPYSAQGLTNQCEQTPVRISGYNLPCTAPIFGADPGTVLRPGETLALQQCPGETDNQPPTFSIPPSITATEDDPATSIPNWASGLSVGAASEVSSQTLNFTVANDNPSLFAVQPSLAANGTLSYTLAPDRNGSATLTVNVDDGAGGTAGPSTSTMTVAAVNDPPRPDPDMEGRRVLYGYEGVINVIFVKAQDEGDYTFKLSGEDGEDLNGQFYFPRNTLNVADRIAETSFYTSDTDDILGELFTPVSLSPVSYTRFAGSSARFNAGFVFAYVPGQNEAGTVTMNVVFEDVEDGLQSDPIPIELTVRQVNEAPTLTQGGNVVAGDTREVISFYNEIIGDPYVQSPPIELGFPASTNRADLRSLGATLTDIDFTGTEDRLVQLTASTTLPASGGSEFENYGACAVSMTTDSGVRTLVFEGTPYDGVHPYSEARQLVENLSTNCRAAATGTITVDINDIGTRGRCPPGHPENYPNEQIIDIVDETCTRNSRIAFDVEFTE